MPTMRKQRYWYRIFIGECPVCGRDQSYRERVYGRRPKPWKSRHVILSQSQAYDYCLGGL